MTWTNVFFAEQSTVNSPLFIRFAQLKSVRMVFTIYKWTDTPKKSRWAFLNYSERHSFKVAFLRLSKAVSFHLILVLFIELFILGLEQKLLFQIEINHRGYTVFIITSRKIFAHTAMVWIQWERNLSRVWSYSNTTQFVSYFCHSLQIEENEKDQKEKQNSNLPLTNIIWK